MTHVEYSTVYMHTVHSIFIHEGITYCMHADHGNKLFGTKAHGRTRSTSKKKKQNP